MFGISTHILTKRMTILLVVQIIAITISTHILTKRMTGTRQKDNRYRNYFNSHPHEEDDVSMVRSCKGKKYFNSHPHEEDDNTGRYVLLGNYYFNSHPHEEDD